MGSAALDATNQRNALVAAPLRTQAATSLLLFTSGDVLAQHSLSEDTDDIRRYARMTVYTVGIFTPWHFGQVPSLSLPKASLTTAARADGSDL